MKTLSILISSSIAFCLIAGCGDDHKPSQPEYSKSCGVVAISAENQVYGVVTTVDHGYYGPEIVAGYDQYAYIPYTDIWKYDEHGHQISGVQFGANSAFRFGDIEGMRPLEDERLLIAGVGAGLTTAVLDSDWQYDTANLWEGNTHIPFAYWTPAVDGMACLYSKWEEQFSHLVRVNSDGQPGVSVDIALLPGTLITAFVATDASVLIARDGRIDEFLWSGASGQSWSNDTIAFDAIGYDSESGTRFFGIGPRNTTFVVATPIADQMLNIQSFQFPDTIFLLTAAAKGPDAGWFVACTVKHSGHDALDMIRYDGSDSITVTDTWMPSGKPYVWSAATATDGWVVVSGQIDRSGYNDSGFLRAYSSTGFPLWVQEFNP